MAAKLILSMDGAVIKEYPLNKERMTIGRKPHNDIAIDNLAELTAILHKQYQDAAINNALTGSLKKG